ncbi:MAG: hypothetical protein LBK50_00810 [Candidatus Nomurabacteria bacterium]|jgi:hypothetical protein|nr:hypothetical protein [Candidatus Nomurabacteria bacterium]
MIERFRVKRIIKKYDGDFSRLISDASKDEMRVVLTYVAKKANDKQSNFVKLANTAKLFTEPLK